MDNHHPYTIRIGQPDPRSLQLKMKVLVDGIYKQTADMMKQTLEFIGKWQPTELYAPTCHFPEFSYELEEADHEDKTKK